MKRKIIYSFVFAVVSMFLVVGCGSNSKENPIGGPSGGPYSFFNASTPVTITQNGGSGGTCGGSTTCPLLADEEEPVDPIEPEEHATHISVQLLKNGLVEPGQSIQMRPFDRKYGEIVSMVVDTDENGYAIFEYKAPEDYSAIIGQDITIQAFLFDPLDEGEVLYEDESQEIILTQDFVLQFR